MEKKPQLNSPQIEGRTRIRFSEEIKSLLESLVNHPLTVSDILAKTQERGFSLLIGLLVLPFLLPMPPGFTTAAGGGALILSVQMLLGRRSPWLPPRIARFQFPQKLAQQMLSLLKRFSGWVERIAHPRWSHLTQNPRIKQINGFCISWLVLLLMAPIPLTNPIPAVSILTFVIATLEEDGLLLCLSYGLAALNTVFFGLIAYFLWQSPELIRDVMQNLPNLV